jgi:small subunit ribosomal protein S10
MPPAKKKAPAKKPAAKAKTAVKTKEKKVAFAEPEAKAPPASAPARSKTMSASAKISVIRIRLSAFDHTVLDEAAAKIIETAERSGAVVHGPIPLPTHIRKFTVNRSTFVHKDARDQFEMRTHRRLIDLKETTFKTMESLQGLSLPSGVDIEIKMG